jgi:hypothetical protein
MQYGSFETTGLLGNGGLGVVWRARHDDGTEVALKVVRPFRGDSTKALRALRREIQAVAALNHRGIVQIVDVGEFAQSDDVQTWFAMEIADGGTFEEVKVSDFSELSRLLFDILDALSYAHARGIIHRDIKPSNILLASHPEGGWRCLLTDFGIAHVSAHGGSSLEDVTEVNAGTPSYMAPEQFHGDWRNYGPWTDLYALGCLAFEMVTGAPPFPAESSLQIAMRHLYDPLPKPVPTFAIPDQFAAWLERMTEKDSHRRYRSAADAAWGLAKIVEGADEYAPSASIHGKTAHSAERGTLVTMQTSLLNAETLGAKLDRDRPTHEALLVEAPPVPYFVVEATEMHDRVMFGVGLNLFGLRQTPFVGRIEERESLWGALRRAGNGTLQIAVITGESGSGRSRLMQWLAMRSEEVGAMNVINVHHSETGAGAHGLGPALARALGVQGLRGNELVLAIEGALRGMFARSGRGAPDLIDRAVEIAQMLVPEPIPNYAHVVFETPRQRHVLVAWMLELMASSRPVMLAIDEAQWGWDTLAMLMYLTQHKPDLPILAVVVVSDTVNCPIARTNRQELAKWPHTVSMTLGPLSEREHESLVRAVAPLDAPTISRVVAATSGHPGRVMHVIRDLIDRGLLQPGAHGFGLRRGIQVSQGINSVWAQMLKRLEHGLGDPKHDAAWTILEIAVALGGSVDPDHLEAVARRLDVDQYVEAVLVTAFEIGLMRYDDTGWSFTERDYEIELRHESQESGRWANVHRACAALVPEAGSHGMPASERRFVHLDLGGFDQEALLELTAALEDHLFQSSYQRAGAIADDLERRLATSGAAPDDARRLRAATARLDVLRFVGRLQDASDAAHGMEQRVTTCADAYARADALRAMANIRYSAGDSETARSLSDKALVLAAGNDLLLAKLYHGAAWFLSNGPRARAAAQGYAISAEHARKAGSDRDIAWALHGLSELKARLLEEDGRELAHEARDVFAAVGSRTGWSLAQNVIADFESIKGNFAEAERLFHLSADTLQNVGSLVEALVRGRFAVFYFSRGDHKNALIQALRGNEVAGQVMSMPARLHADLVLMTLHPDETKRKEHREIARALIERTQFDHPDFRLFGAI